jgi:hypothetical protein
MGGAMTTANELMDAGRWEEYCEKHSIDPWAVNEGLIDPDEELSMEEQ